MWTALQGSWRGHLDAPRCCVHTRNAGASPKYQSAGGGPPHEITAVHHAPSDAVRRGEHALCRSTALARRGGTATTQLCTNVTLDSTRFESVSFRTAIVT